MNDSMKGSLVGVKVIDFSTLLPGPLASLFLAETGAEVIKIERPEIGDEIRSVSYTHLTLPTILRV